VSDHRGRIEAIARAATDRPLDMANLIYVIRQNLKAEHDEGWQEGHLDGQRDIADAERFEDRRRNQDEQAARAAGTSATEAGEKE
jgi:hypothetical protein